MVTMEKTWRLESSAHPNTKGCCKRLIAFGILHNIEYKISSKSAVTNNMRLVVVPYWVHSDLVRIGDLNASGW
jgi:hypothetical protein